MQLLIDSELSQFSRNTDRFLEKEALLHSMIRSLVRRYLELQKSMSLLVRLVDAEGSLIAAGIQTELERALILSQFSESVAETFAEQLAQKIESLPAVNGPSPAVDAFVRRWASLKNKELKVITNLRLFELREIIPARKTSGQARLAQPHDRDLIFQFLSEFRDEAVPHDPKPLKEDLYQGIDRGIERGIYFLWEDQGAVVSLVGSSRETAAEKWIAPVYTPPAFRGKGYGSALTAYVSEKILEAGKLGVLFTDQLNPTSNSIYQKIGYRPVADFKHIAFE